MKLLLADLPQTVRQAYEAAALQSSQIKNLERMGTTAIVEAVALLDNANGIIYTTRDGGQCFEAEQITKTVDLQRNRSANDVISVRRVVRISETGSIR